jgi:hypothetical protein
MDARATVHAVGLVGGLAGGYALAVSGGSAIAPPVFAGSVLAAVVVAQLGRARPELVADHEPGASASLRVRRVRDYVPRTMARAAIACAAVAIVGLGTILGYGRFAYIDQDYYPSHFAGPFSEAGSFPGIGIVGLMVSTWCTVVAVVLLGALVLWLIAHSRRPAGDPDLVRRDELWRQEVAATVTAAMGWVTAVPVAAVAFAFATTLIGRGPGGSLPAVPSLVGAVAVLLALRFAARLLDEPQPRPTASAPLSLAPVSVSLAPVSVSSASASVSPARELGERPSAPVTGPALEAIPEAPTVSPQWTGVRG